MDFPLQPQKERTDSWSPFHLLFFVIGGFRKETAYVKVFIIRRSTSLLSVQENASFGAIGKELGKGPYYDCKRK